jgi:hypothetical protein
MGTKDTSPGEADAQGQAAQRTRGLPLRRGSSRAIVIGTILVLLATIFVAPDRVLVAVGVVVGVGLLTAWVLVVPRRLAPPVPAEILTRLDDNDRLEAINAQVKLQNDLRTTALQAVAGLAVLAGAVLGFQQLTEDRQQADATRELTLQGQASERFTRAIDQLGNDRIEVRLGGIYGLEQVAQQAPTNRLPVTEVLVAFLRRQIPRPAKPSSDPRPVGELGNRAPDAQAALTVLGRRQTAPGDPQLDLHELDLRGADLPGANLIGARLFGSNLGGALLNGAALAGANLFNADLTGAHLADANIRGANLDAELALADLHGATADQHTTWPDGFAPQDAGVRVEGR